MHETITVLNMPGIRTRAGLIRVLEYDKNFGLISTNDSLGRINILFMIVAGILNIFLVVLALLISARFQDSYVPIQESQQQMRKQSYLLQSISSNGEVSFVPFNNHKFNDVTNQFTNFSLPTDATLYFGYQYDNHVFMMHGNYEKSHTFLTVLGNEGTKEVIKKELKNFELSRSLIVAQVRRGYIWILGEYIFSYFTTYNDYKMGGKIIKRYLCCDRNF